MGIWPEAFRLGAADGKTIGRGVGVEDVKSMKDRVEGSNKVNIIDNRKGKRRGSKVDGGEIERVDS